MGSGWVQWILDRGNGFWVAAVCPGWEQWVLGGGSGSWAKLVDSGRVQLVPGGVVGPKREQRVLGEGHGET